MYKITIVENAQNDLEWFKRNDRSSYIKCFDLVRELVINPRSGTGKSECKPNDGAVADRFVFRPDGVRKLTVCSINNAFAICGRYCHQ